MNLLTFEEFKNTEDYKKFMEENPEMGYLKVNVYTAYKAVPIPNTEILITKTINNNNVIFFQGITNSSGSIENITLPAPKNVSLITKEAPPSYTLYDLTAVHKGYSLAKKSSIGIIGEMKVIQNIKMNPEIDFKGVDTLGN